jgi:hypothetical protein
MTPDRIEQLLRTEPVADEARFVARALPASVVDVRARLGRRRGSAVMRFAAASAVGAVAVVAIALGTTRLGDARGPSGGEVPSGSASQDAVATTPATPVATPNHDRCTAADFAVTSDPWDAGAGSRGTRVVFRVVDSVDECTLGGSLAARIVDASGAVLVEGASDPSLDARIRAGTQLEIGVSWSNWCGAEPAQPIAVSVTLAGDDTAIPLVPPAGSEVLVPPCMGSGQGSVLNVTPFEPSTRPAPEG